MKKLFYIFVAALMVFTSCDGLFNKKNNDNDAYKDSLNRVLSEKDAEINQLLGTVNEVQEGLRQITAAQGRVSELKSEGGASSVESIREEMAFIQRTMDLNRDRITELKKQLQNNNINTKNLRQTIESLQTQIDEKAKQIETLQAEIERLNIKVAEQEVEIGNLNADKANLNRENDNLAKANESKAQTISKQDKALNQAWYVFGTKRELKDQNILNSGEVLTQSFNRNYMTEIDIRQVKSIYLGSKSATLLTKHPAGSYTIERDDSKMCTLRITDYKAFWSLSKYLVVQVK